MKAPLAIFAVLVLAAGAYLVFFRSGHEGAPAGGDNDPLRTTSARSAAEAEPTTSPSPSSEAPVTGPARASAAARSRLAELGFDTTSLPSGAIFVVGRVVQAPEASAAEATTAKTAPLPPAAGPTPVSGAAVEVFRVGNDQVVDASPSESASTRDDGRFLLSLSPGRPARLRGSAPGFATAETSLASDAAAGDLVDAGDLALSRLVAVRVEVTSGAASIMEKLVPVRGMALRILREDGTELARGRTADDGAAAFAGLPRDTVRIEGALENYGRLDEKVRIVEDGQKIALNVQLVGKVRLRVKTPAGTPLLRCEVAFDFKHDSYGYLAPKFESYETKDEDGWHLIEDIKAGREDVYATAKGFALGTSEVLVEPGRTTDLEITLPPGFPVEGVVVTKGGDRPIEGAIVYSETDLVPSSVDTAEAKEFRSCARAVRTDASGRFRIEDLTEATHRIAAVHQDYAETRQMAVKVGRGAPTEPITLKMSAGAVLSGHVYDREGQPSSGELVIVMNHLDARALNMKKQPLMARTDDDGAYRIDNIPAGARIVLRVREGGPKPGEQPFELQQVFFKDGVAATVDFGKRDDGTTVSGRVTDRLGNPAAGLQVMLMSTEPSASGPSKFYSGQVDAEGRYSIRNVEGGDYAIHLAKAGKGSDFAGGSERVTVPERGEVTKDLVLAGGSIEGRVLAAGTRAAPPEAEIVILGGPSGQAFAGRADTDADGNFSFAHVEAGTYTLFASAKNHAPKSVPGVVVAAGTATTVPPIELQAGGRMIGRARTAEGAPIVGARIILIDPSSGEVNQAWSFGTQEDGSFVANAVPAGPWRVSAVKAGLSFEPVEATVPPGDVATVELIGR